MIMQCNECNRRYTSKKVIKTKMVTYAVDSPEWHKSVREDNPKLTNSREVVSGYCGCLGWL